MSERKLTLLEVMRGLAASWVVLHHAGQSADHFFGPMLAKPLVINGFLGVDFFFVLSGFIIAYSSHRLKAKGGGLQDYLTARLIRIYVPYLPVGIGMFILYLLLPGVSEGDRSPSALTSLTLLPSDSPPALSVAWTLVHEMIFYTIYSLWFLSRNLFRALMLIWITAIGVGYWIDEPLSRFYMYFLSPLNLCFVLGVGIHLLSRRLPLTGGVVAAIGAVGLGLVAIQAFNLHPNRLFVAAGFGLIVLAAATPTAIKFGHWRWAVTLGSASYAIYLVHNPVISLASRVLRAGFTEVPAFVGFWVVSFIGLAAGVMYWWAYESRALRVARNLIGQRQRGSAEEKAC